MNLVIDIGNTQVKFAVFSNKKILKTIIEDEVSPAVVDDLIKQYPDLKQAISCSVGDTDKNLIDNLRDKFDLFIEMGAETPIPIENMYDTKETLGYDRIAASVGANSLFPCSNLLIIDAGTAITYDLVDENNRYLGGNISPGLEMRYRALHEFTKKLPLVQRSDDFPLIGKTTEEAIRTGVQSGIIAEMDAMIDKVRDKWIDCKAILTGGDSFFFDEKLKNTIFVMFELTLLGLNRIIEYNAENK
jgi:type III pantothenate kinase